jgi:hypothetical protein
VAAAYHRVKPGEVPERLNGLVSKTSKGLVLFGSSNLPLSASSDIVINPALSRAGAGGYAAAVHSDLGRDAERQDETY